MVINIRAATKSDLQPMVELTLKAFEPIFESFESILGEEIFPVLFPDWRETQQKIVVDAFKNEEIALWVAEIDEIVTGLVTLKLDQQQKIGELHFLAVHPDYQNRGVGSALNQFILEKMRKAGMQVAMVSTGGDSSHAPARRTYEKAGYIPLPIVNYYQKL